MSAPTMRELLALIEDKSRDMGMVDRETLRENFRLLLEDPDHPMVNENLRKWFKEKWVRFGPDGKIRGACARGDDSEGKPKCLPQSKAHSLGKKGRKYAASKKRREDPNPERRGKAINVATKRKTNEGELEEACWKGYHKEGMKTMFGKRYPNCVKNKKRKSNEGVAEGVENSYPEDFYNIIEQLMSRYAGRGGSDVSSIASSIIGFARRNPQYVEDKQQEIRTIKDYLGYDILVNPKDPDSVEQARRTKEQARSPEGVKKVEGAIASILGFTKNNMVQVRSNPRYFGEIYKVWGDGNFTITQGNPDAQPDPKQGIPSTVGDGFFAHYTNLKHLRPQEQIGFNHSDTIDGTVTVKENLKNSLLQGVAEDRESDLPPQEIIVQWFTGQLDKVNNFRPGFTDPIIAKMSSTDKPDLPKKVKIMILDYIKNNPDKTSDNKWFVAQRDLQRSLQQSMTEGQLDEKWSKKYKRSIDCDNPKGFSQRAHCQGRKKNESVEDPCCPQCGGELVSEEQINEKKDACYYKVKSRYKVWPSAYASGALVKCRKVGASKWGSKGK